MKLSFQPFQLELANTWAISDTFHSGGKNCFGAVFVELRDHDGVAGLGETAPSSRYAETVDTVLAFLRRVDPAQLSFRDLEASTRYLDSIAPGHAAARTALNLALVDGAARHAGRAVCDFLELGFTEDRHLTSFSIGMDGPEMVRAKAAAVTDYPILKLKVGGPHDRENIAAVREVAPGARLRLDANEAWAAKEEALRHLEWLAEHARIEFIEQPMPAASSPADLCWLKARSPIPLIADESLTSLADLPLCAEAFHGVNVKLVKFGGLTPAKAALAAARHAGLKTMIGSMIESSLLTSAGAHLAELADHLDIDGSLLITNDPFEGVSTERGLVSFARAPERHGLRVRRKASAPGRRT